MQTKPDVFSFLNYREYLNTIYLYLKSTDKKYSYRYVSMKVGSSSPSWLSDIIKGRINLTEVYREKLSSLLKLSVKECDYFNLLVNFDQAGSHNLKKKYLDLIFSSRDLKINTVQKNQFDYFRKWYIPVIREYLFLITFKEGDYKTLSKALLPGITPKEAKEAINTLRQLQLITENSKGEFKPTERTLTKDSSTASVYIPTYHLENIRLAGESIERFTKEERNISSVTVHLNEEMYEVACEEIRKLRQKLLSLSNNSHSNSHSDESVYQCNLQLFPVTQKGNYHV